MKYVIKKAPSLAGAGRGDFLLHLDGHWATWGPKSEAMRMDGADAGKLAREWGPRWREYVEVVRCSDR